MLGSGLVYIRHERRPRAGAELENPSSGSCFLITMVLVTNANSRDPAPVILFSKLGGPEESASLRGDPGG